jgi:hypothetical protein
MLTFIELSGFSKRRAELLSDDSFKELQESSIHTSAPLSRVLVNLDTFYFEYKYWARPGTGKSGGVRIIYYNRCE